MTSSAIRQSFLDFFEKRAHRIVPSAPVIPHGDPTLLFTNAGMNQFKDVFLGTGTREYVRAADTQKCIRVSGKHNDLEEVGRDTYHHTFFEMLGNWSFGDYYKKEAIAWAWELLTKEWGLEKKRLYATVYETDDEAFELWKTVTDIDPTHVLRFGKKDNFWEMGETGPCGPCSEIHIDLTPDYSGGHLVNAGDPRVMEIWNLVFIQYNRNEAGELEELPAKHVDTGMGFERICAVLQGKRSNYDTDVFMPIIARVAETVKREYTGSLDSPTDIAMRVIADHIRMLTFAITDGALPGNEGRGYVLRRILRRAARFGRTLGMHEPFIYTITGAVVQAMGKAFPEIVEQQAHVERVIKAEEESFNATLDRGLEIFESVVERIGHSKVFPGSDAFKLYDTYGFPLDLTQLMAEERGLKVDVGEFTELMEEQRERSRKKKNYVSGPVVTYWEDVEKDEQAYLRLREILDRRDFVYEEYELEAQVEHNLPDGSHRALILSNTTFYSESGGQVSDTGSLVFPEVQKEIPVLRVGKTGNRTVHVIKELPQIDQGARVITKVDVPRRVNIQRNHSATHLVHEALRRVLGTHVHQQGSLVAPDHLRFDFPHFGKITPEELRAIEEMVNEKITEDIGVFWEEMPIEKARTIPNVKMFFGEKYGDIVRVVFIDEAFSVEFCGGTHVTHTKDIGLFKIISESSIASGVRRIEAVTGEGVQRYIEHQLARTHQLDDQLAALIEDVERLQKEMQRHGSTPEPAPRPSLGTLSLSSDPRETLQMLERERAAREQAIEHLSKHALDLRKRLSEYNVHRAAASIDALVTNAPAVNGFKIVSTKVEAGTMDELKSLGDTLRAKLGSGVGILASIIEEKVALVCVVTDDLIRTKNLQAGKIVSALAKELGGGGGGKPHLATAGGKDVAKLDTALAHAPDVVRSFLKN